MRVLMAGVPPFTGNVFLTIRGQFFVFECADRGEDIMRAWRRKNTSQTASQLRKTGCANQKI